LAGHRDKPMSETGETHAARLLRAYQAQERRFVERRFPLEFAPEVPALRELYSQAKGLRGDPETDRGVQILAAHRRIRCMTRFTYCASPATAAAGRASAPPARPPCRLRANKRRRRSAT
jgi:hypothetical protein